MFTKQKIVPVFSLLTGAIVWGLIWYPYRVLQATGIAGDVATFITYFFALIPGLLVCRGSFSDIQRAPRIVIWIGLSAGWANLAYVLAVIEGEVVRVLLLFYLAPLWTVLLARALLKEQINRHGMLVVLLSLSGALIMLWHPETGWPLPQNLAEWLGLSAGCMFALSNVLSRKAQGVSLQLKALSVWAGVAFLGLIVTAGTGHRLPSQLDYGNGLILVLVTLVIFLINPVVQYGLSRVSANRAIVIFMSELVVGAVSAYLLADEAVSLKEALGGAMIIAASLLSGRLEQEPQPQPA
jgi:drug/metabolite transporter (DMT)-like permease